MGLSPYIIRNDPQTFGITYRLIRLVGGGVRVVLLPQNPAQHKICAAKGTGMFPPITHPEKLCWVGENYQRSPRKLLILSESFYDRNHDLTKEENPSKKLVEWCALNKAHGVSYYHKLARVCAVPAGLTDTFAFWNGVALLHFVPQGLHGPRLAPSRDQMRASLLRCVRLVEALTPTAIVIPSKRLWRFLVAEGLVTETDRYLGQFTAFADTIPAAAIGHPASATKSADSSAQVTRLLNPKSARS